MKVPDCWFVAREGREWLLAYRMEDASKGKRLTVKIRMRLWAVPVRTNPDGWKVAA